MAEVNNNVIFDAGLHKGEDTDFYLKKGFDVVAFEANADLIESCKHRFREPLARGQLRIIEGAIAPDSAGKTITFYKSPVSVWGTIDPAWVERNARMGVRSSKVEVNRVDIVDAYRTYGIPHYLKVDIEGADILVLEGLKQFTSRPQYLSIEAEKVDFSELKAEMQLLCDLGYTKFKLVQQGNVAGRTIKTQTLDGGTFEHVFEPNASGPFGDDISGPWLTLDEVLQEYQRIFRLYRLFGDTSLVQKLPKIPQKILRTLYRLGTGHRGPLPGWYDTHASL
jgi:FkbM family methyltransferase